MRKPLRVLIVEESERDASTILTQFRHGDYDPVFEHVETPEAMKTALTTQTWDIVLSNYRISRFGALAALALLKETGIDLPFIIVIVSEGIGEETAVAAIKAGAHDLIVKSDLERLISAIDHELKEAEARRKRKDEVRKLAARILRRQGYKVLEAFHPGEAAILCEQHTEAIHLMFTDVVLPIMSGRKLAEELLPTHPEIKVLYMSGYTDNAIAHHGVLEKGLNYIQKPFTVGGLVRKIREVLDKKSAAA
ncbi:MAG: response regulator [Deltaproteobacteria bacterium]|nr:MAG: response regulator [Deltaproteobacteria bacterium]